MSEKIRKIILGLVLVLIAESIWYLQTLKPAPASQEIIPIELAPVTLDIQNESDTINMVQGSATGTEQKTQTADEPQLKTTITKNFPRAKEIVNPAGFVNTSTLKLQSLVGKKVILVDFWTYSCINCIRTQPYLNAWYEKYKNEGLEIVGIHTPEFEFEKSLANVKTAVKNNNIKYPVVLDNDYGTWSVYNNRYWPRKYLIDIYGYIIYDHIGEGGYDATETLIQTALAERANALGLPPKISKDMTSPTATIAVNFDEVGSPEIYFGAERNHSLKNGIWGVNGAQNLTLPNSIERNGLYLSGAWNFEDQYAANQSASAKIVFKYYAKNVYFVGGAPNGMKIKIYRDGIPLKNMAGDDVVLENGESVVPVKENRLYKLIEEADYGEHTLEILIENPGLRAYTFTFG